MQNCDFLCDLFTCLPSIIMNVPTMNETYYAKTRHNKMAYAKLAYIQK